MKKIISLALCMALLLSLTAMVSVSAAASGEAVYSKTFDADASSDAEVAPTANVDLGFAEGDGEGAGSAKFTFKNDTTSSTRIAVLKNMTFKTGKYYEIRFRGKADTERSAFVVKAMIDFSGSKLNGTEAYGRDHSNHKFTSEWTEFSFGFKVDSFEKGEESCTTGIIFEVDGGADAGDVAYLDSFEILEYDPIVIPDGYAYYQEFNSDYEFKADAQFEGRSANSLFGTQKIVSGGVDGTGAYAYTFIKPTSETKDSAGSTRLLQINNIEFKKGNKYVIGFSAKEKAAYSGAKLTLKGLFNASNAIIKPGGAVATYPSAAITLSTDWKSNTLTFTIDDFGKQEKYMDGDTEKTRYVSNGKETYKTYLFIDMNNSFVKDDEIYLDNIYVKEYEAPVVTVNFTGEGTVKHGETVLKSGDSFKVTYEGDDSVTFEAGEGRSPFVTVNGKKVKGSGGVVNFTDLTEDQVVNISFEEIDVMYENYFNSEADAKDMDFTGGNAGTYSSGSYSAENEAGLLTIKADTSSVEHRIVNLPKVKYEKGYEYTIKLKAKSTRATSSGRFQLVSDNILYNETSCGYPASASSFLKLKTDAMYEYEWKVVINDVVANRKESWASSTTASSKTASLAVCASGLKAGDTVLVDDVVITRVPVPAVTINLGEGGTLTRVYTSAQSVDMNNGAVQYFGKGKTATYKVVPSEGKLAKVVYNGQELTPNASGEVKFVVNENSTLDVTFKDANVPAGIENGKTTSWFRTVDGKPTIYVYSQLSDFTGDESLNYGIRLWNKVNPDAVAVLLARDDMETNSVATPGKTFAIKVYGDAITEDASYEAVPFIGDAEGNAVTPSFEE